MRFFKLWVGLAMVAALVLGITLGNYVLAGGNFLPGSTDDPLVSESYITQTVEEKTSALEYQIFELEKQVTSLTNTVAALESQMGRTSTSTSSSTQPSQSTQTNQTSQAGSSGSNTSNSGTTTNVSSNTEQSPSTGQSSSTTTKMEVSAANGVNVRNGPSTSFSIIASLSDGTKLDVISESSGWYEIVIEGSQTGWVHGDFVK